MSNEHEHRATTLYRSPQEARQAPPEEFLYLACLHEGTGVEAALAPARMGLRVPRGWSVRNASRTGTWLAPNSAAT